MCFDSRKNTVLVKLFPVARLLSSMTLTSKDIDIVQSAALYVANYWMAYQISFLQVFCLDASYFKGRSTKSHSQHRSHYRHYDIISHSILCCLFLIKSFMFGSYPMMQQSLYSLLGGQRKNPYAHKVVFWGSVAQLWMSRFSLLVTRWEDYCLLLSSHLYSMFVEETPSVWLSRWCMACPEWDCL